MTVETKIKISKLVKNSMFANRIDAGIQLSKKISKDSDSIVLAIPRGGVVLGSIIAEKIGCTLDIVMSKKITPPENPEYAIGAIMHDGTIYKRQNWEKFCNHPRFIDELNQKQKDIKQQFAEYRKNETYLIEGKTVFLVDDGIATGSTVLVTLEWLKKQEPKKIVLMVPVMPRSTFEILKQSVDEIICLLTPIVFSAVGQFYKDFSQVSDIHVKNILKNYYS